MHIYIHTRFKPRRRRRLLLHSFRFSREPHGLSGGRLGSGVVPRGALLLLRRRPLRRLHKKEGDRC